MWTEQQLNSVIHPVSYERPEQVTSSKGLIELGNQLDQIVYTLADIRLKGPSGDFAAVLHEAITNVATASTELSGEIGDKVREEYGNTLHEGS